MLTSHSSFYRRFSGICLLVVGALNLLNIMLGTMPAPTKVALLVVWLVVVVGFLMWASASIASGVYVDALICNRRKKNMIALSFDDGPDEATPQILDMLKEHQAKASFFIIGKKIAANKEVVLRMIAEGHTVGHHSWSHSPRFPLKSSKEIRKEIVCAQSTLEVLSGQKHSWFRPPYGVTNPMIANALKGLGLKVAGWSIRSLDTKDEAADVVYKRVVSRIKGGDIVLLHDTSANILPLLERLLISIAERKMECVSIDSLVEK
ncbi:MAG TPA: xylanase [Marinilabiliaceae bacterium]|nr:xylanase [Marinilabiliaceae bacterium]